MVFEILIFTMGLVILWFVALDFWSQRQHRPKK